MKQKKFHKLQLSHRISVLIKLKPVPYAHAPWQQWNFFSPLDTGGVQFELSAVQNQGLLEDSIVFSRSTFQYVLEPSGVSLHWEGFKVPGLHGRLGKSEMEIDPTVFAKIWPCVATDIDATMPQALNSVNWTKNVDPPISYTRSGRPGEIHLALFAIFWPKSQFYRNGWEPM